MFGKAVGSAFFFGELIRAFFRDRVDDGEARCTRIGIFVADLVRRWRVHAAIMFCGQAKSECDHDEDDDSLFLPSQNESLLKRVET